MNDGKTTIQVSKETAAKLGKLGNKGDTYEKVILRLMKQVKSPKKRGE